MSQTETLYSARQLADELEITLQMLSKYAQAYTKLAKRQIKKQGRDGRHFTSEQRDVIRNAREMVRSNTGVTVEDAIKRALIFDAGAAEIEAWGDSSGIDLERLKAALSESVTMPLIKEVQALRDEVAALRTEQQEPIEILTRNEDEGEKVGVDTQRKEPSHAPGPLARAALWIERRIRG